MFDLALSCVWECEHSVCHSRRRRTNEFICVFNKINKNTIKSKQKQCKCFKERSIKAKKKSIRTPKKRELLEWHYASVLTLFLLGIGIPISRLRVLSPSEFWVEHNTIWCDKWDHINASCQLFKRNENESNRKATRVVVVYLLSNSQIVMENACVNVMWCARTRARTTFSIVTSMWMNKKKRKKTMHAYASCEFPSISVRVI